MVAETLMKAILVAEILLVLGVVVTALTSEQRTLTRVLGTFFTILPAIILVYAGVGLIVWGATPSLVLT
ncbi:hypothetical protein, partial [Escherichia coli]|uniref:hypothetical protein n=1 Tax=Escherichia coli TaxID=562 RepID=UPI00195FFC56